MSHVRSRRPPAVVASPDTAQAFAPARIGPNAILRVTEVVGERDGRDAVAALLWSAGLERYVSAAPSGMVDERDVVRLHGALRALHGVEQARAIAREAGLRTGDYLLAHRIPRAVQLLLRVLPAPAASRILLDAMRRHAWTFAGSASFTAAPRRGGVLPLALTHCPLCREASAAQPLCDYYAGTFERLYRRLVSCTASVVETHCEAQGAPACRFEVRW